LDAATLLPPLLASRLRDAAELAAVGGIGYEVYEVGSCI